MSCSAEQKSDCEYDDNSHLFRTQCLPATKGSGSHPGICFVGSDPCSIIKSDEDYCPRACVDKCCLGNRGTLTHPALHPSPATHPPVTHPALHPSSATHPPVTHPAAPSTSKIIYYLCPNQHGSYDLPVTRPCIPKSSDTPQLIPVWSDNQQAIKNLLNASRSTGYGVFDLKESYIRVLTDKMEQKRVHYTGSDALFDNLGSAYWGYKYAQYQSLVKDTRDNGKALDLLIGYSEYSG